MKVIDIRYNNTPSYKPVTCKADYDKVQQYIYDKTKDSLDPVILPKWDELNIQHRGNIIVFTEAWECVIEVLIGDDKYIIKYRAEIGFICDKGSVPKFLRSYIDNDSPKWLIAFIIHDMNYACHHLDSRKDCDKLLKAMGLWGAENKSDTVKPKARIGEAQMVYWALTIGGKKAWKTSRMSIEQEKKFSSCKLMRV